MTEPNSKNRIRFKLVHQQNPMAICHRVFALLVRRGFELLCNEAFVPRNGRTSCPLRKALIMLFRGEMRERICNARTVTERKANRTLREKGVRPFSILLRCTRKTPCGFSAGCFSFVFREVLTRRGSVGTVRSIVYNATE